MIRFRTAFGAKILVDHGVEVVGAAQAVVRARSVARRAGGVARLTAAARRRIVTRLGAGLRANAKPTRPRQRIVLPDCLIFNHF